jgi:hypothetical protein
VDRMRNYVEKKMKDAKPIVTETPPIEEEEEEEEEQVTEGQLKVNDK